MTRRRWRIVLALAVVVMAFPIGWATYAGVVWLAYGSILNAPSDDPIVERYMPVHEVAEVHETRVAAPVEAAWAAAERLDLQRSAVIHTIFRSREVLLGASPPEQGASRPMLEELRAIGWGVLEEVPGREIVFGAVTQPWLANVTFRAIPRESFAAFDSAGYVKVVVSVAVDSVAPGVSRFRTETRVLTTDAASRAKFRRYWAFLSPGIILIRREALALVRRDALTVTRSGARPSG